MTFVDLREYMSQVGLSLVQIKDDPTYRYKLGNELWERTPWVKFKTLAEAEVYIRRNY